MVTEDALRQRFAENAYWEDSPEISVLSCGKDGSVLTVQVSGDVNIAKLPVNRRVHAQRASDSGFAWCVETYDVVLDGDQIDVVECSDITFSELELSLS